MGWGTKNSMAPPRHVPVKFPDGRDVPGPQMAGIERTSTRMQKSAGWLIPRFGDAMQAEWASGVNQQPYAGFPRAPTPRNVVSRVAVVYIASNPYAVATALPASDGCRFRQSRSAGSAWMGQGDLLETAS
jgi:hypothetical protein